MKAIVWITEGTWPACVDTARELDAEVTLLHVIDPADIEAATGPRAGLLGRGTAPADAMIVESMAATQTRLLDAAQARLGRPAHRDGRTGRTEHQVVAACADAGLLILARDGDHARLGPHSLGRATRFVVDHAPCRVLLVWPDQPPSLDTLPPGPPRPHDRPPPPHHRPPP
jgi:nucleotide-binding universal stress UspA family protein